MGLFASPSVLDVGYAQEGAFMSINAIQRSVPHVTSLAKKRKGRATRPRR